MTKSYASKENYNYKERKNGKTKDEFVRGCF